MFLSGAAFPVPMGGMFILGGRDFHLVDLLPPRHAVIALNKVFTLGAGLNDVWFELTALTVLSLVYFYLGVWLFRRMHMQ
jgi:ABC-2 type transport system permease protein